MKCNETPTHNDKLTCQKSAQYMQAFREKVRKTIEWCFKASQQLRSYWAHLHIKHYCEVEITYMCNNVRHT